MISILYDKFKYLSEKGSVYIYSDPHFSDTESFEFRKANGKLPEGITTIEELDEYQIKSINSIVNKNDTLIILGDIGNTFKVSKLKAGYKVLLLGNHDNGASNYKRTNIDVTELKYSLSESVGIPANYFLADKEVNKHVIYDNKLFDEVYSGPLMISDKILLSHEPIIPCPDYFVNLCGHIHAKEHLFEVDGHKYYNFCAEAIDYKPISLGKLIKEGLLSKVKDIHRVTIDGAIIRKSKRKNNIV